MAKNIGGPRRGHAAGDTDIEKQASQLASDTKYKVKERLGSQTNLNPAQVAKAYLQQLAKSPAPGAVKALAKKKIMGNSAPSPSAPLSTNKENYEFSKGDITETVENSLINVLHKVFVEEIEKKDRVWIVVRDKKTGNTYRRSLNPDVAREKIAELRANPNISSVEITKYKSDEDDVQGRKTARVKAGKGLKNDGNLANNYPPYDKVTRGDVIAGATGKDQMGGKKKVKEEVIFEKEESGNRKKITGKGVNNYANGKNSVVKVFPKDVSEQLGDENVVKNNISKPDPNQQAQNRRQLSILQQFQRKEEQLNRKKIAALKGNKIPIGSVQMNSYEPEGESVQEVAPPGMEGTVKAMKKHPELSTGKTPEGKDKNIYALAWWMKNKGYKSHKKASGADKEVQKNSYQPEGEVIDELRASEKRGLGSPESPLSYPGRKIQKERGEKGGRHWQSGGEGGSRTERGRTNVPKSPSKKKPGEPESQVERLRRLSTHPEQPSKYARMQSKKRDLGSRFD
jgi:hypothetical protein